MIRPPSPPNRVENLMDFQDTVQRGDTLEAMEMQRTAMQPPAIQPPAMPVQQMPMKKGGLLTLPVYEKWIGGMIKSLAGAAVPSLVGRAAIGSGFGLLGGGIGGLLAGFLTDKIMGNKTNLRKNLIQGIVPVAGSYLRGGPTNIMPEAGVSLSGPGAMIPTRGMIDYGGTRRPSFVGALGDQFTRSNLEELATEAVVSNLLTDEQPETAKRQALKDKPKYRGVRLQKAMFTKRPSGRPLTQEEIYEMALGRRARTRTSPDVKYTKTARGGGLTGMDFEGRVPGRSDGMEDDQYYAIRERGGPVEGLLAVSPKEYVLPADAMSILGNGNPDAGADAMDKFVKNVRMEAYGTPHQQKELNAMETINRNLRG